MKAFDKKISVFLIVMLCFIIGGTLSFESLARFSKKFSDNQTISTDKFKVDVVNTFEGLDKIVPGDDLIAEDKITLSNTNNYPVEFTVKLKLENMESDKDLLKYLELIIETDAEYKDIQDQYVITLQHGETKDIFTKIKWKLDENGEVNADIAEEATVKYLYDIKAKQLGSDNLVTGDNIEGGGESTGSTTTPGNESNNGNKEIKSVSLKDILWVATSDSNKSKIKVFDDYTIIGANADAVLENLSFDLKEEKIIFNADIELLNTNTNDNKGVNFALEIRDSNSTRNILTYQLYKYNGLENKNLYAKVTNSTEPLFPNEIAGSGAQTIETLNVNLVGEITSRDNFTYAKFSMRDRNNNIVGNEDTEVRCREYKSTDKAYININNIMGKEGIKINSMEIKAVSKDQYF